MQEPLHDFVILGAGLAGVTFALEVARRGRRAVVLEREPQVGGLARTVTRDGFRFDLGGHRFHTDLPLAAEWVASVMGNDLLQVSRLSHIYLNGHFIRYPLQFPNFLTAFSLPEAVRVLSSYLVAPARRDGQKAAVTFEDWVVQRFGRGLYDIYFRPYTEKVWGIRCTELSADWASQRISLPDLSAAVKESLLPGSKTPRTLISRFLYPPLGIGTLVERAAQQALATGWVTIALDSPAARLEWDEATSTWRVDYFHAGREHTVRGRQVVSTVPLDTLARLLPREVSISPMLNYRGLICVFLALTGPRLSRDTWTYYPAPELSFGRTHEPPNWSPHMAPDGHTSLCVEVFCSPGDAVWERADGETIARVLGDLERLGRLSHQRVRDAWLLRVPGAYPIYRLGYAEELRRARESLARWPSLHLLGRTGSFQYLNMDSVIVEAIHLAARLCGVG